jgi:hypothetical protein
MLYEFSEIIGTLNSVSIHPMVSGIRMLFNTHPSEEGELAILVFIISKVPSNGVGNGKRS